MQNRKVNNESENEYSDNGSESAGDGCPVYGLPDNGQDIVLRYQ
jgi:hypothetical protein